MVRGLSPANMLASQPRWAAIAVGLCLCLSANSAWSATPTCEAPPAPVRDLRTRTPYQDERGSIPDEAAQRANAATRAPLNSFLQLATEQADRYVESGAEADRLCALSTLTAWASDDALGGRVSSQGEAVRQWAAGTVALVAFKLGAPQRPLPAQVRQWLLDRARDTQNYMKERIRSLAPYGRSNIYYWSILTVGSIAIVTDSRELWTFANREYLSVLPMIAADGTLTAELRRGGRASLYHAFAAQPLVAFAALSKAKGQNLPQAARNELDRLMDLVLATVRTPQLLAKRAGATQTRVGTPPWLPLYAYVQSNTVPARAGRDDNVQRLGGSIKALIVEIDRRRRRT